MYHYIKGTITEIFPTYVVVENDNIGYLIKTPNPFSFQIGDNVKIYTYVYVRESIFDIYGFKDYAERELFIKLISVKGIGPKGALAIIANGDINRLEEAINSSDVKYLQRFPGIGPKASSQIILDLKGKINLNPIKPQSQKLYDVNEALKSLGYNKSELKKIEQFILDNDDLPIAELIKMSLQKLI
ncbi:MAG TPA: Holliday junction branch migration protein RuvA [Acholeplasmataceae bacterium]|nr:Holliday junction branch migration protein RuvA [Acholeplasmataceae bacterium]